MKAVSSKPTRSLNIGSLLEACDNSGARIVRIVSIKKGKTKKGRQGYAKVSDWVKVSVRKGDPKMKGEVFEDAPRITLSWAWSLSTTWIVKCLFVFLITNLGLPDFKRFNLSL